MAKAKAIKKKSKPKSKAKTKTRSTKSKRTESHGTAGGLIPTERSVSHTSLDDYSCFMHGEKKVGKTSGWACDGDVLFLEFDPEQKALEIFQIQIPDWVTFQKVIQELKNGRAKDFKRVVIDGTEIFYQLSLDHSCMKMGIKDPEWGEWRTVKNDFTEAVNSILNLPIPATFLSHSTWKEYKKGGNTTSKFVQNISGVPEEILIGPIDIWCAYTYDGDDRVIIIVGDEEINAGHRIEKQFRTVDGRAIKEIYCGESPLEMWENFNLAFENKLEYTTLYEMREGEARKGLKSEGEVVPKTKVKAKSKTQ